MGIVSEPQQQLAEAIREAILDNGKQARNVAAMLYGDPPQPGEVKEAERYINTAARFQPRRVAAAVEPFLVAAERAGYERCKRDASKGIEALRDQAAANVAQDHRAGDWQTRWARSRAAFGEALAVVAGLNATQQPNDEGDAR